MFSRRFLRNRCWRVLLAAMVLVPAWACGSGDGEPRVSALPRVEMPESIADGEPIEVRYVWEPGADFQAPAHDYKVFVHLLDAQGQILLQDDHYPAEPTSQWKSGEPLEYIRWLYLPRVEVEQIRVVAGLYGEDGARVLMGTEQDSVDAAPLGSIAVRVDDMSGVPVWMDGWHSQERVDDAAATGSVFDSWYWSEGGARVVFTNPRRGAVLHLRAHSPFVELNAPQTVILRVGEQEIWRHEVNTADAYLERIDIPADLMGDADWVEVALEVSPVWAPRDSDPESTDDRQLGLQVFDLYLSPS